MAPKVKKKPEKEIDLESTDISTEDVMSKVYDDIEERIAASEEEDEDGLREGEREEEGREEEGREKEEIVEDEEEEGEKEEPPISSDDEDDDEDEIEDAISSSDFQPPSEWSDDAKAEFEELPDTQKESILQIQRGMQSDFQKAINSVGGILQAMDPIKQECIQYGLTYEQAIRKFVGMHTQLLQDPAAGVRAVMQTYGVTPEQVLGVKQDGDLPQAAQDRIAALEQQVQQTQQGFVHQHTANINQQVEEFKKTAEFFNEVEQDMVMEVNSRQAMGQPIPPLKDLYDRACWANPAVRQKLIAKQKADEANDKIKRRKKKVAQSKRAAKGVKRGTAKAEEKEPPKTLHDILSREWDQAEAKANEG